MPVPTAYFKDIIDAVADAYSVTEHEAIDIINTTFKHVKEAEEEEEQYYH